MKRRTFLGAIGAFLASLFAPKRVVAASMPRDRIATFRDGTVVNYSREYRKFIQNECYRLHHKLPRLIQGVQRWECSTTPEEGIKWLRAIRSHLAQHKELSPSTDDVIAWLIKEKRPFCEKSDAETMRDRMWAKEGL